MINMKVKKLQMIALKSALFWQKQTEKFTFEENLCLLPKLCDMIITFFTVFSLGNNCDEFINSILFAVHKVFRNFKSLESVSRFSQR